MSEMVERVAQALHMCVMQQDPEQPPWGHLAEPFKNECLFMARAAIEAMREPTEAMITAGDRGMTSELLIRGDCKGPWMNMITEALK